MQCRDRGAECGSVHSTFVTCIIMSLQFIQCLSNLLRGQYFICMGFHSLSLHIRLSRIIQTVRTPSIMSGNFLRDSP